MTIFDIINSVLYTKNKDCMTSVDQEDAFSPYIFNRWLSMYSPQLALISNEINKYMNVFETKQELFTLFFNMFPKVKNKRIQYFKRTKEDKKEDNKEIPLLAESFEISQREVRSYIDLLKK